MQSIKPKQAMLPLFLYAYQMKRLHYWQAEVRNSYTDALARYFALAQTVRDRDALNQGLLISIGKRAQEKLNEIIDSIEDEDTLSTEEQKDLWSKAKAYQLIVHQASEALDAM